MNLNREPIKNWFGFTRRERRSTFIMLLIIIMVIALRYTIPDSRIAIVDISGTILASENHYETSRRDSVSSGEPFSRNHINSGKSAQTYIKKTYGIEGKRMPFIKVKQSTLQKVSIYSKQKKSMIEINRSDSATLVELPGIGPVLSARIIKYRHLLGGFARIEQLKEVYGLPEETFESIKGRVFADSTVITRININSATYKELLRFPYFEKHEVSAIMKYRELKGRINWIDDLTENKLITTDKAKRVGPYLKYDD
jgi:DNA uptake protein and related DNA-binding proteins